MENQRRAKWIGIDFGTTNSAAISLVNEGGEIGRFEHGDSLGTPFPSIIGIHKKTGEVLTGREAKNRRYELSEEYEFFTSLKSIIDKDEVYEFAGKKWTPVELAAEIIKGLKSEIARRDIVADSVVMAVPIGFSPKKKKKLREAAKKAGIHIESFISEPTAAFISNYKALKACKDVAVFDWGGGTLDVVILHISQGCVEEISSDGMDLAGDDIDRKIAEKMHIRYCNATGKSKSFEEVDLKSKDRLLLRSEDAKKAFSDDAEVASIMIPNYDGAGVFRESIDYDFFNELVQPEVEEAIGCLNRVIEKAGLNNANIDAVLCVGGSSKLRPFRERVTELFGKEKVVYPEKVMWDIAKGAAYISYNGSGRYGLNHDIGLIMSDGTFYPLLMKGQHIPCKEKKINFACVTTEKSVRFLITDAGNPSKRTFSQAIEIDREESSFLKEQFEVSCFIDPDLLLRFRVRSTEFTKRYLCLWTYEYLKIYYQIEGNMHARQ